MKRKPQLAQGTIITIDGTGIDGTYEIEDIVHGDYHLRNTETDKLRKIMASAIDNSIASGVVTVEEGAVAQECIFCGTEGSEEQFNKIAGKFVCDDCLDVIMAITDNRIEEREAIASEVY